MPAADLALVSKYGPGLQDPKVVASLTYLQEHGAEVQQAVKDSPIQWQRWWWICLAGQIVFLPFVWSMTGRWSPKKAKADADAHAELVNRELAALASAEGGTSTSA